MRLIKSFVIVAFFIGNISIFSMTAAADQTIWLVRHAEKQADAGNNPDLTEQGLKRSQWIANFLKEQAIQQVYSTQYTRTIHTVEPVAQQRGLSLKTYDPSNLDALSKAVVESGLNTLIGGHSNVTPRNVNALTGLNLADLEDHQYDHLYKVTIHDDGRRSLELIYTEPRTK